MTILQGLGLAVVLYILLLARSAWKEGEIAQFARSLAVVGGLAILLAAIIAGAVALDGS